MLKQKLIILLTGLIFISSVSSFFIVTCHGSDGHITPEPAGHNHCECTEDGLGFRSNHEHCKDVVYSSHLTVPSQKSKIPTQKISTANILSEIFQFSNSFSKPTANAHESTAFFAALQTVILIVWYFLHLFFRNYPDILTDRKSVV